MVATNILITAAIALAGSTTGITATPLAGSYLQAFNGQRYNPDVTIHSSCTDSQESALKKALKEMNNLADIAAKRILKNGADDEL